MSMPKEKVEVVAYSGYRGEEVPRVFKWRGTRVEVGEVRSRWMEEGVGDSNIKEGPEERLQRLRRTLKEATIGDVFLTGTNAITQDGRLVNVDAVGNRIAGIFWGHPVSIVVVGRNKIVKDLEEAFYRIRNVIAPNHVRIRSVELGGRESRTPCVATGECSDCRAADRVCNIFGVIEGKPFFTDLSVVLVDEDLGLGWDPAWPQNRIDHIVANYKRFVWVPPRDRIWAKS